MRYGCFACNLLQVTILFPLDGCVKNRPSTGQNSTCDELNRIGAIMLADVADQDDSGIACLACSMLHVCAGSSGILQERHQLG